MAADAPAHDNDDQRPPAPRKRADPDGERRCIVTMETRDPEAMVRFVVDPAGVVVPDVAGRLPGRGAWVTADKATLAEAVKRNAFARAFKRPVSVPQDLAAQVEALLAKRVFDMLGLANRAGEVVTGHDKVRGAIEAHEVAVLIEAGDASEDGRHKLRALFGRVMSDGATAEPPESALFAGFTAGELGMALGRERVVHACLKQGRFARAWMGESGRLAGFRPPHPAKSSAAGTASGGEGFPQEGFNGTERRPI